MTEIIHPNEEIRVSDGAQVDLHFSVAIASGAEIDNTRGRDEPVTLTIGGIWFVIICITGYINKKRS